MIFIIIQSFLHTVVGIYLLYQQLGKGVYFGCVVIVLTTSLEYYIGKLRKKWYADEMKNKDARVKLLHELLSSIRVIKLFGWETAFSKKVSSRSLEETFFSAKQNEWNS